MNWILGQMHRDLFAFYGAGLIACAIFSWIPENTGSYAVLAFIVTAIIDAGHGYTTIWRAFRRPNQAYPYRHLLTFVLIALLVASWMFLRLPFFWSFVIYFTLYHHIRQFYGLSRWYQTLNQRTCEVGDKFLYALLITPLLLLHVRPGINFSIYGMNEIFFFPHELIYKFGLIIYGLLVVAWILFESKRWSKGYRELNRLTAIGIPVSFHIYCFLIANTMPKIIMPLITLHGVTYFAIMSFSLKRLSPARWTSFSSIFLILTTALLGGSLGAWLEDSAVIYDYTKGQITTITLLANTVVVTPALWHYIVDGSIWRRSAPETKFIIA